MKSNKEKEFTKEDQTKFLEHLKVEHLVIYPFIHYGIGLCFYFSLAFLFVAIFYSLPPMVVILPMVLLFVGMGWVVFHLLKYAVREKFLILDDDED